jgi:hypothetical protein
MVENSGRKRIPLREELLSTPLSPLEDVRLLARHSLQATAAAS